MSLDGSFCLHLEFERLIYRCPKLGGATNFISLVGKGDELKEEEVVNALAAVLLHPSYTIPIMGCFRAIAKKIVERVVELLKLVPNLRFNQPGGVVNSMIERFFIECEEFDDIENAGVIEVYSRHGRFLDLHELANLAFCRVLDLAPFLKGVVDSYYEFGGPPFARIMEMSSIYKLTDEATRHLRDIVWTSYRLLLLEPEYFPSRWNWCCFLDLVHQSGSSDTCSDLGLVRDIRWCGVQILCVLLRLPNRSASFGIQPVELSSCLLRWSEFCWDVSIEKAGWYTSWREGSGFSDGDIFSNGGASVAIDLLRLTEHAPPESCRRNYDPFLMTSSIKSSFERVMLAVNQRWPVLLYGPPGCGKSALINKLAHESGNQVLSIYLDEQVDGRTLVGSYVCTEQPGVFRWQPGPLTQAVKCGLWVVFENIDQAASDVQSILLPLLEGGSSFLTGYGEAIRVAAGFRLFSTISTSKTDIYHHNEGRSALSALWRRVLVRPAARIDLASVVGGWYPDLEPIAEKLIETFERLNGVSGLYAPGNIDSCSRFSLRDLLKWCKRVSGSGFIFEADGLSVEMRSRVFMEAVDVFAAYAASPGNRLNIVKSIADMWALPLSTAETLYSLNRPILQDLPGAVQIGRVTLERRGDSVYQDKKPFVEIRNSSYVLERIACAVNWNEPVLLVGETGTGKTTLVQNLAARLGQKLTVLNLSQQTDVADLLGGFKPTDPTYVCMPLYKEFENLFSSTFSLKDNEKFLAHLKLLVNKKNWTTLLSGFQKGVHRVLEIGRCGPGTKRKRPLEENVLMLWECFSQKVEVARKQIFSSSGMIFSFVEGAFVTALRNGEWILLDEVNLAPPETLQRIIGVLGGESGSLCLAENGVFVDRHPNFRLFACMNPATDAGKRDLPYSLRSRFTEFFVDDVLDDEDLALFVNKFLDDSYKDKGLVSKIVHFYKAAKKESEERLQDGANQRPQYSLRSLYRALEYTRKARNLGFKRALYDGFCMFFMTLLDDRSAELMHEKIVSYLLGGDKQLQPPIPLNRLLDIKEKPGSDQFLREYIITKSVEGHIRSLARAAFIKRYPVLLQGPTSSGKTSLVQYLAAKTGHEFVRINNHEHTDLQEYLGSYITDANGRLVFHEGVLVKAVRNGHWIVLDELNLAPSDVLEALNRLLDDNRELFVPELRETVRAHPDFMLFATQNPPTFYGGRKMLSRAFRNRFVEIHVDEIPDDELTEILAKKCQIPDSHAKVMIKVMKELQLRRQNSKVFAGKHGFITPRDLFRWAHRSRKGEGSYVDLARDGYYLLAERLRDESEKKTVQDVLEYHLHVTLKINELYEQEQASINFHTDPFQKIVQTKSMQRLFFLVKRCYELKEPVLLVGETGGGKTTVCQLLNDALRANLHVLNCHQYTETSDFIGGFYPIRERPRIATDFKNMIEELSLSKAFINFPEDSKISPDIGQAAYTLDELSKILDFYRKRVISLSFVSEEDIASLEKRKEELSKLYQKWQTIFTWQNGPLVQAMKHGDLLLVDEISLADDSVLERLNSVLEPDRKLSLAEKGGPELENVTAHDDFFLLATMNPGGDYGKKELSPALRNRFTEIWVPAVDGVGELKEIARRFLNPELHRLVDPLIDYWEWFNQLHTGRLLTVRDLLAWLDFLTKTEKSLQPAFAFLHGAFLVLLDGLSLGTGMSKNEAAELRERSLAFLVKQLKEEKSDVHCAELLRMENYGWADVSVARSSLEHEEMQCDNVFGIHPFYIEKGSELLENKGFEFLAPTTRRNVLRVLRAMQLQKPVLLEGSPGVGKTSLIAAIGKFSGHNVVRINLSEQTDIMDLLGSDLPIESEEGLQFAWSDGILLQALREGSWVLLDEINLAQQSVLEGLNAILDHRAEVFIPELGQSFKCPSSFRVFACQNPTCQGGGRKGLPKSFLNRFSKVYVDELGEDDYSFICRSLFPAIPDSILSRLILFNRRLYEETMLYRKFAQVGSPWEFNLRDVIRSCQIIQGAPENIKKDCFLDVVYVQRMRTVADRREVLRLYEDVFGMKPSINPYPRVQLDDDYLHVGNTSIMRNHLQSIQSVSSEFKILPGIRNTLEAAVNCIQKQWLCILVGPTSSGKTSMIRLLAHLTGNKLNEVNLSAATDISELLGSFEQYNAYRNFCSVVSQIEGYVNEYCSLQLDSSADKLLRERRSLITKWLHFSSDVSFGHLSRPDTTYSEKWRESLSLLVEIIELLIADLQNSMLSISFALEDLSRVLLRIHKLQQIQKGQSVAVKFEWAAGPLIKAIENGEWIVLEDANLCNPTVLDRINSLVESNGSITVNECGNVDGKPLVLFPHPNFRMFLTINPSNGEVSRAMRNRGIEIFMMQPNWLIDDKERIQEIESADVRRFLALCNIPNTMLVDTMAKAHIHAQNEGQRLDVQITYLELGRWVHLFQQLLMTGNDLLWSLLRSWEHSYLSSLGESTGWGIVREAEASYLTKFASSLLGGKCTVNCQDTVSELNKSAEAFIEDMSLCLPGGWPAPLELRDFVWYSRGANVKQSCMYLEYLGVQYASYHRNISKRNRLLPPSRSKSMYLVDVNLLLGIMYPKGQNGETINYLVTSDSDAERIRKKLLFAVDWVVDQVAERTDIDLNLLWFSWFNCQLQPYSNFFGSVADLIRKELGHPIWECIFKIRDEIALCHAGIRLQSLPLLALESVDVLAGASMSSARLCNAIRSVGLLRRSLWQWNAEINHDCCDEYLKSVMQSLRNLEEEVLSVLVESPSFDFLYQSYVDLLEEHILIWNVVIKSHFETLLVHWRSLMKILFRMRESFPEAIKNLLRNLDMMSTNLSRRLPYSLNSEKSLLWAHGGHPSVPSSADVVDKLQQLESFSKLVWPRKITFLKQIDHHIFEMAASTDSELRSLAMQGVCMTSSFDGKYEVEKVAENLEEIYQMLQMRFQCEKSKLESDAASQISDCTLANSVCCTVIPDIVCSTSGFESWMGSLPIADDAGLLLDLLLLQDISEIALADVKDLELVLSSVCDRLEYSLRFSINFSSRTPLDFVPHQEILWILDAWPQRPEVGAKIISSVHDMWFNWHLSLWNCQEFPVTDAYESVLPDMLLKPVKTDTIRHIMKNAFMMKDYHLHRFKLRVASSNIWWSTVPSDNLHSCLLSAARSLLQQVIYAHRKSFSAENFVAIKSIFVSFQKNKIKQDDADALLSLLASSGHRRFVSLIKSFVEPLLCEVADIHSSDDLLLRVSCAWLRLGGLRFYLLLACDELDPAVKYSSKYLKLVEKYNSLACEIEVRQHCDYLAGSLSPRKSNEEKARLLAKLESECKRMKRKVVFRSDPGKFIKLKEECNEFSEMVSLGLKLLEETDIDLPSLISRAGNWQATANNFVERLSEEYSSYKDIIQPIQIAVYEMKLGMALLLTNALQKDYLGRLEETRVDPVLDVIYSFMRFPHGYPSERHVQVDFSSPAFPFYTVDFSVCVWMENIDLLKRLITSTGRVDGAEKVESFQLEASLFDSILGHVVNIVANTNLLDASSFAVADKVFDFFTSLWRDVKIHEETKKDNEAQLYKFKPRAFKLDDICEIDLSSLGNSFSTDSFTEWKELLLEEEKNQRKETDDQSECSGDWNLIPESMLNTIVNVHNQLFGSRNLVETPGIVQLSDLDKLHSFMKTYTLGASMVKDITGISGSCLDSRLVVEHVFRLCLEHEQKLPLSQKSAGGRNFYKDPNPTSIAGMVPLLIALRQKVVSLLKERDEHAGLQKILDITEMLLALPGSTSVAQALSGLQFLVSRVKLLQENGAKFPLNDELQPITSLVSSFQKMEFDTWNTMLDEVFVQFEMNAAKLWFPLYSVLHRRNSTDVVEYARSTLKSMEELIQTSNVGEFRRRLQLILSFYGHLSAGISLGSYASCTDKENRDILFNMFGFYVQYLPIIMEHIETSTRSIKKELEDLLKLCGWERPDRLLSVENSKRSRQKLKKLVQKYTDALQQPVMVVLTQKSAHKSLKSLNIGHSSVKNQELSAFDISQFGDLNRIAWYSDWKKKFNNIVQCPQTGRMLESQPFLFCSNVNDKALGQLPILKSSDLAYREDWSKVWHNLEKICRAVVETAVIWKEEGKLQVKTRAFSDLLKLLENSGLSKHKSTLLKLLESSLLFSSKPALLDDQVTMCQSEWWFFLPSYDVQHLLPKHESLSFQEIDIDGFGLFKCSKSSSVQEKWRCSNQQYFKSLASVRHLEQVSLNFHKDFNPDQVNRTNSFIEHLVMIQMEQRAAAYDFSKQLEDLREYISCLKKLCSAGHSLTEKDTAEVAVSSGQHLLFRCIWQQKELFDALCSMLDEDSLMLKTVGSTHSSFCQSIKEGAKPSPNILMGSVKTATDGILAFIEKFIPLFKKSKAMLDHELLGGGSAIKVTASMHPILITKEMEQFLIQNFQLMRDFQEHLLALREQRKNKRSIEDLLLAQIEEIIAKAKKIEQQFHSSKNCGEPPMYAEDSSQLEAGVGASLNAIIQYVSNALQKLGSWSKNTPDGSLLDKITSWKLLFDSYATDIQLEVVRCELDKIMTSSGKLANICGLSAKFVLQFKTLEEFLTLMLDFGDGLLHDFLGVHEMVSALTHSLAEIFASLFFEGYGKPSEDLADDTPDDKTQDASGTGMGEGVGVKDVSDQITDENQLLGTSAEREEQDVSDDIPNKNDEGIEMEEDLNAPALSVSEDSSKEADNQDDDENDDEQVDSAMGNTGDDGEVADEKLWDKEQDADLDAKDEKRESGPSVKDRDSGSRELRAKDDSAAEADEKMDDNSDTCGDHDELDSDMDNKDDSEAMNLDEEAADPTDIDLNDPDQDPVEDHDEMEVDLHDTVEEDESEEKDNDMNNEDVETDTAVPDDETSSKVESNLSSDKTEDNIENNDDQNGNMDLTAPSKDMTEQGNSDLATDQFPNTQTSTQPINEMQKAGSGSTAPEMKWSMSSDMQNDLTSSENSSQVEVLFGNSLKGNLTDNQPKSQLPPQDASSFHKNQPNPLRDLGDALQDWKERVKVSADLPETNKESVDDVMDEAADEAADEYGYTSNLDKGTAQALGSAMPEQMEHNIGGDKPDGDGTIAQDENQIEELHCQDADAEPIPSHSVLTSRIDQTINATDAHDELSVDNIQTQSKTNSGPGGPETNLVSVTSYMHQDTGERSDLSAPIDEAGKVQNLLEQFSDMKMNAGALWRNYELRTTRLSQELAEQLRLIMEPTLASKLQGDYRTGKRINMKKVIQYIASYYRRDKIWLRRTKPNKRDYQVVIAVDDSRSMSENCCGDFAIEALVTVCRALSQLEVGKLAVTSFGKQGNVRLLHDFDQPWTGDAGMKIISSLTFNQENTLREEPMVDLLRYMNNMLEQAVVNARLPSGQNPLQQLVLIIADGRFHDNKEKLKRCIRDVLNRNCMVAFLVLDSAEESIMEYKDYIFKSGIFDKAVPYLDSFPFPYYIVLRNIEALPRTLADLLRQWFELMQHSRD